MPIATYKIFGLDGSFGKILIATFRQLFGSLHQTMMTNICKSIVSGYSNYMTLKEHDCMYDCTVIVYA